jgi:hypothetical protein
MSIPPFTAEVSIYAKGDYRQTATPSPRAGVIEPAEVVGPCEPWRSCCLLWDDRVCCQQYSRCLRALVRWE